MRNRIALGALSAVLLLATARASGARAESSLDPCSLLRKSDVTRLTTWQVDSVRKKRYNLGGATGSMCFFEASQGTVIVMMPDHGYPFPGESSRSDLASQGVVRRDPATGVQVTYYNGTIYMNVHRRDVAVRLVPASHIASFFEVEPFAGVVIPRIHS